MSRPVSTPVSLSVAERLRPTAGPRTVLVVLGTRPEAVKLAPVVRALEEDERFTVVVVSTGQHREMLHQVSDLFGMRIDRDLNLIEPGQSLSRLSQRALAGLSPILTEVDPDLVLVQGDTTTVFVASLAAFYAQVPIVHLEAGLRTGDLGSPFPEEANRRLTGVLADLHLAPTTSSRDNLLRENVDPDSIVVTGNTVIDALHWAVSLQADYGDERLADLDQDPRRVVLVTAHRRESWGEPMRAIGDAVAELADQEPDVLFVLPLHLNPLVREAILPAVKELANVLIVDPLPYGGMARLMARASVVLTDSGGVQEEAPSLGKPVLVLRENTERPEAVEAGTAKLVGTDTATIVAETLTLLRDELAYRRMAHAVNPYGDGRATERVVAAMAHLVGAGTRAVPFAA